MKHKCIRLLIPLFLFFGIIFSSLCSLTVYAAPTAPDSVTVSISMNGSTVTQAAKGSKITISAQAHGGSGTNAYYEYSFLYKAPSGGAYVSLRAFGSNSSIDFTATESGTYIFRVMGRVTDSKGSSQSITKEVNFRSIGISNTSTISSSAVNIGESVTINASATGGTNYEYYYSVSKDGGSNYAPIQPSSTSAQYTASASCTYKPAAAGNYLLRVLARDKSTGSTDQKVFSVTASSATITNLCDVSQTEVEITNKDQSISLIFNADKGKAPYSYRCSYIIEGSGNSTPNYVVGSASGFESVGANRQFKLKKAGTYLFTFEVIDSSGSTNVSTLRKRVSVTANLVNTTTISSNSVSYRGEVSFQCSAKGGTGDYEYKLSYKINGKQGSGSYNSSTVDGYQIPGILEDAGLPKDYKGKITFTSHVRDVNLQIEKTLDFIVEITEASAVDITRQDLNDLVKQVREWEQSLKQSQREHLEQNKTHYVAARDTAYQAVVSDVVQNYEKYYFDLNEKWMAIKDDPLGDEFWMTKEVNNTVAFENTVLKNIEGWFTSFSGTNVSTGTFNFNMEDFVNQFSQIFVIFASSLLVILFGVNIIKTALEYQLFTLKGAVTIFGRLILSEIWIQLSTKICVMVVKIFNELMASILSAINASGMLKSASVSFTSSRSGVWLIGDLVDFFANLCPFLLIMLLIGIVLVIFLIVYVKLIIRTLELSMLAVVSPVFFACSVGEATMPYFRKFITAFLSVGAEIIFMGIVYLAFLWYCQGVNLTEVSIADLYNFSSTSAGTFYTYIAVTVACGVMMIKPPQVLRDLMR